MRPNTLAEAVERILAGEPRDIALAEFVDNFLMAPDDAARFATIEQEPRRTADARLDALVGAIAEYLSKHHRLGRVPPWVSTPWRRLDEPWFTTSSDALAMREYLAFAKSGRIPFSQHLYRRAAIAARSLRRDAHMIIAIDGPAASGKGTLGKRLAQHFGLRHLDTGLLYRAVAAVLLDAGHRPDDRDRAASAARTLDPTKFDEAALKRYEVGEAASVVSAVPEVRAALFNFQQEFATTPPGAVLDGRDIGTVICPNADVKIFVTATPEVRARRRTLELRGKGERADEAAVLADILARDERDRSRPTAPLLQASDAHLLDTTHLDIDAAFRAAVAFVEAARAN